MVNINYTYTMLDFFCMCIFELRYEFWNSGLNSNLEFGNLNRKKNKKIKRKGDLYHSWAQTSLSAEITPEPQPTVRQKSHPDAQDPPGQPLCALARPLNHCCAGPTGHALGLAHVRLCSASLRPRSTDRWGLVSKCFTLPDRADSMGATSVAEPEILVFC